MIQFPNVGRRTITSNYTTVTTDSYIEADTSGGNITLTLNPFSYSVYNPLLHLNQNYQSVTVKKIDSANTLTIQGSGSTTINSGATLALTSLNDVITFLYNSVAGDYRAISNYNTSSPSGGVTSVSTSSGGATPIIDIAGTYVGQASITTLGTIGTGVWQGTSISTTYTDAKVISVTGTANRITSTGGANPVIDIGTDVVTLTGSQALSNKTGLISQWTNDVPYLTSTGITPAALTRVDDTNVTLTLGGTPATALLQATSLTLGWTGTLADARITSSANWNTAYTNRITSLTTTGTSGAATLIANTLNIPQYTGGGSNSDYNNNFLLMGA